MKTTDLFAKALILNNKEHLVIKFETEGSEKKKEPAMSGEIRLSNSVRFMSEMQKARMKKVLISISQYVTETYIT